MNNIETRPATGKVLFSFTMSLDGFVAGPHHDMGWMTGFTAEPGLIDEIDIHVAPILLGDGIRLYHNPGKAPIRLHRLDGSDPTAAARVRYRPIT